MSDPDSLETSPEVPDDLEHTKLQGPNAATEGNGGSDDSLLEAITTAIAAYREPNAPSNELQELVERLARTYRPEADVYVAKLTSESLYNIIWQGRSITGAHDLYFFVLRTGSADRAIEEAKARLNPPVGGGFEAIMVLEQENGSWVPRHLYHYDGSDLPDRLHDAGTTGVEIVPVTKPSHHTSRLVEPADLTVDPELLTAEEVLLHLQEAKNVVLEGPPGTGKSRMALEVVDRLSQGSPDATRLSVIAPDWELEPARTRLVEAPLVWEMIQFHASYSYEDFVRGLRIDPEAGGFAMTPVDGILTRMARVAKMRAGKPTLLVVDEVNRASLPAVLGEAVFALDPAHRGRSVRLQHGTPGAHSLTVPTNLFLLGTMNTADRSISLTDVAIRRRFRFLAMDPSPEAVEEFYRGLPNRLRVAMTLFEGARACVKEPGLQVGHSYFLVSVSDPQADAEWAASITDRLVYAVRPLLAEYTAEGISVGPWRLQLESIQVDIDLLTANREELQYAIEHLLGSTESSE